ncbi:Patatin-like phospholipase domain-containing protein 4 [Lamellibrachia satsuma]|nr:Patatin-like phospholipase domain-containing protein 4 [Lamellibrachia satsuma]
MYKLALCVNKMAKLKPLVDAPVNSLWRDGGTDLRMQIVRITSARSYNMSASTSGADPVDTDGRRQSTTVTNSATRATSDDSVQSSLNLSFCGCGFLGIYHLGVASKFAQCGRRFLSCVDRYAGASAGSLVACLLGVIGPDPGTIDKCSVFNYRLAESIHETWFGIMSPHIDLLRPLELLLYELLPDDAHQVATGRLFLSLTNKHSSRNVTVSSYDSNDHLVQCLLASCCIPRVTGRKPVKIYGKKHVDGGLTNNMPILTRGRTVTVSPFSGHHDVCPRDPDSWLGVHVNVVRQDFRVNVYNVIRAVHTMVPPDRAQLRSYFRCGANDAERFLRKERFFEDEMYVYPERRHSI